jgi:two-component system alkaline phosphatase synthesis response regulator PhoP
MIKVLLVDDEPDILEFLKYNLETNGFNVFIAENGIKALELAEKERPDIIVLDIMMPGMDGIEVCNQLREKKQFKNTIIVFLSARSEDYSHVAGFEAGADDYLVKPIRIKIFVAKLISLYKRKEQVYEKISSKVIGDLTLDYEQKLIFIKDQQYQFPKKEFKIFSLLCTNPGKVFTREEIYMNIWGNDVCVSERTLDVHIRKIREKIGDDYIVTVKGIGYKVEKR